MKNNDQNEMIRIPLFPNWISIHNYFADYPGEELLFIFAAQRLMQALPDVTPDAVIWN